MAERPKALQKARQQKRLSAALRENLKRRKAQANGRAMTESAGERALSGVERAERPHDSAGIGDDK
jgi:hypothetical protein